MSCGKTENKRDLILWNRKNMLNKWQKQSLNIHLNVKRTMSLIFHQLIDFSIVRFSNDELFLKYYVQSVDDKKYISYKKLLRKYLFTIFQCPRCHQNTDVLYEWVMLIASLRKFITWKTERKPARQYENHSCMEISMPLGFSTLFYKTQLLSEWTTIFVTYME